MAHGIFISKVAGNHVLQVAHGGDNLEMKPSMNDMTIAFDENMKRTHIDFLKKDNQQSLAMPIHQNWFSSLSYYTPQSWYKTSDKWYRLEELVTLQKNNPSDYKKIIDRHQGFNHLQHYHHNLHLYQKGLNLQKLQSSKILQMNEIVIIPLEDPFEKKAGEKMKLKILFQQKPLKNKEVNIDLINQPNLEPAKTNDNGEVELVIPNEGLNVFLCNNINFRKYL